MKRHATAAHLGRIFAAILFAVLFAAPAPTQVTVEVKKSLVGVTSPEIVGQFIFVGADSNPSVADVAIIAVEPGWKFQILKVRRDGVKVSPDKMDDGRYRVAGKGVYDLSAVLFDPEKGIYDEDFRFELGGATPGPQPPKPDPVPPNPSPAPIAEPGFRVLVVYETADLPQLPRAQQQILTGPEVRGYLDQKCAKASGTAEWRFFDKDTQFPSTCDSVWCKAMKRPRTALPWLIVSDGKSGYEGPLPPTVAETLDLLKKWGG